MVPFQFIAHLRVFGETLVSVLAKPYVPLKSLIACFVFTAQLYTKRDIINQTSLKFRGVFFKNALQAPFVFRQTVLLFFMNLDMNVYSN